MVEGSPIDASEIVQAKCRMSGNLAPGATIENAFSFDLSLMTRLSGCWMGAAADMGGSPLSVSPSLRHTPVTAAHDAQEVHAVCRSRKLKLSEEGYQR